MTRSQRLRLLPIAASIETTALGFRLKPIARRFFRPASQTMSETQSANWVIPMRQHVLNMFDVTTHGAQEQGAT